MTMCERGGECAKRGVKMRLRCAPLWTILLALLSAAAAAGNQVIYNNQFAVHITDGSAAADDVARKHGFVNAGQIGPLQDYYLFIHPHIHKRSAKSRPDHHKRLMGENSVLWVEQQFEHRRTKRDFSIDVQNNRVNSPRSKLFFPDPLFKEQWYLNGGAKDGLDMNVGLAWQRGYTGKGVVVTILDDGIQTNHPDLMQNYDPLASFDINDNDEDPMPNDNGDNKHGTRCAGEVAAAAFNSYCGIGVAYNASIGGVRMLDGVVNDVVEAKALGFNSDHIDIYSASWGPEDDGKTVDGPGPMARKAFLYGINHGRKGKGSIFIWASGNGGRHEDSCNCDGYTNSIFTIAISSSTQGGMKPWYLEECSSTLAATYSSGTPDHDKSIVTADMDGNLRPEFICTEEHTGTSASAPIAAGICALALEANPSLTWRDMQHLIIITSRSAPLENETGWAVNGVKRKVSHKFGYGLMDASEMVALAERWITAPQQHTCESQEHIEDTQIEVSYGYTLTVHMDVSGCKGTFNEVNFLEHVECRISLMYFPRGNLRILLTSPMGTTSTLLFERPRDTLSSNFDEWPFLSVHFWGERADGRWTLEIINAGNHQVIQTGLLQKWQLIFYGTESNPIRLRDRGSQIKIKGPRFQIRTQIKSATSDHLQVVPIIDTGQNNSMTPLNRSIGYIKLSSSNGCFNNGAISCISCSNFKFLNTCVSSCPAGSFPGKDGVCSSCHKSCATCARSEPDTCLTCDPNYKQVTDVSTCNKKCPSGYLEDIREKTCVPCSFKCKTCDKRKNVCTSCKPGLVMYKQSCYSTCPERTYENENHSCKACHPACATCNGSAETQCISCRTGQYSLNGKCYSVCPDTYYSDKKRKECLKCPVGCSACKSDVCTACGDKWHLTNEAYCISSGSNNCRRGEYYNDGNCHLCHDSCGVCYGPSDNNCLSCKSALYLEDTRCVDACTFGKFAIANRCSPCPHACSSCTSALNCTSCRPGLRLQSGECRATCAPGYYGDRGDCLKCYISCGTCSGPQRDECVSCPDGWQLAAGECFPECPEGFFKTNFGCEKCHRFCRTCKGSGLLQCTSCPPKFMLEDGFCKECLDSQYYDSPSQRCKECHDACRTCSGPGPFSCESCALPLHLDRLNNQCLQCCNNTNETLSSTTMKMEHHGNFNGTRNCCNCNKDNGGCQSTSPAGKRRTSIGTNRNTFNYPRSNRRNERLMPDKAEANSVITASKGDGFKDEEKVTAIYIGGSLGGIFIFVVIVVVIQRQRPFLSPKGYTLVSSLEDGGTNTTDVDNSLSTYTTTFPDGFKEITIENRQCSST